MSWYEYPEYESVAKKKAKAQKLISSLTKQGKKLSPIIIEGKKITTSFWGNAWCQNLEKYSDYESRLPRGRSYLRNGSVIDLKIENGKITALVNGSSLYKLTIEIKPVEKNRWKDLCIKSSQSIGSLIELLQGKLSKNVMELFCDKQKGLFPSPNEIKMECTCPDWADMCKHNAAVMYGIGNRLDLKPELLFTLRNVEVSDLINNVSKITTKKPTSSSKRIIEADYLSSIFDIDMQDNKPPVAKIKAKTRKVKKSLGKTKPKSKKKPSAKKKIK
jgi:uncharacterized Zn finger protein